MVRTAPSSALSISNSYVQQIKQILREKKHIYLTYLLQNPIIPPISFAHCVMACYLSLYSRFPSALLKTSDTPPRAFFFFIHISSIPKKTQPPTPQNLNSPTANPPPPPPLYTSHSPHLTHHPPPSPLS